VNPDREGSHMASTALSSSGQVELLIRMLRQRFGAPWRGPDPAKRAAADRSPGA